ncbi:unnamed protein product [Vitrella brassicaformis CCMP3155]|uniref:Bestrophin homolog n=1 Tax=Vitrella brassicaformis (strain CCMP3155) TaxID=1169540 RepID=A0A0G4EJC8_VITBC|nr:unnamed protein product [Vitrella brassicaformis CCMP3155]|eukprot:CEL96461.1 unnamed protein product [Vitrella brassicaformis CCMP3155]
MGRYPAAGLRAAVRRVGKAVPLLRRHASIRRAAMSPRKLRRYTSKDWHTRRYSSEDWLECLTTVPLSRILKRIRGFLLVTTAWSVFITTLFAVAPKLSLFALSSSLPHSLMSGAMGLLLVFRTNAAYDRYWEGRKLWGKVISTCRELATASLFYLPIPFQYRLANLIRSFPFLMKQHLQGGEVDMAEVSRWITPNDAEALRQVRNPPLLICKLMSGTCHEAMEVSRDTKPTERQLIWLENIIGHLSEALGGCERIMKTPVPLSYSRHTSRFLTLYCLTLPVVLVQSLQWMTIPVVTFMCWGFKAIEEIGHFIEDPFDKASFQLPLKGFCETIQADIEDTMDIPYVPLTNHGMEVNFGRPTAAHPHTHSHHTHPHTPFHMAHMPSTAPFALASRPRGFEEDGERSSGGREQDQNDTMDARGPARSLPPPHLGVGRGMTGRA